VRWWRLALGAAVLIWVLGTAYRQARRRGRDLGLAVLLVGMAAVLFGGAAFVPRPPMPLLASKLLVVGSVILLAGAMAVVLWRGFRE